MDKRRNVFDGQTSVAPIIEDSLLGRELFKERKEDRKVSLLGEEMERGDSRYPEMIRPFQVEFISPSKISFQSEGGIKLFCSVMRFDLKHGHACD